MRKGNINNKQMFKYLLVALILASACADDSSDDLFLSPPLPPTAYKGEYYTVQFRVIGLDNPVFSFENLPACLHGSPDGTLEGTPDKIGSFAVKVCFKSDHHSGTRNIVVRVAPSVSSTEHINTEAGVTAVNQFIVVSSSSNALTYAVGNKINVNLQAKSGKAPYTWTYNNLPAQLVGDKDGLISGVFDQEGYYSFSASACDSAGAIADSYFTFNVQPSSAKGSVLLEVPNRNVPVRYDLQQVQAQQLAATNAVFAAIKIVNEKQHEAAEAREALGKTTLALQFANAQENAAEANSAKALDRKSAAAAAEAKAHDVLETANKIVQLAKTNLHNAQEVTEAAQRDLKNAEEAFEKSTAALKTANNKFINAQTESAQAAQNTAAALTSDLNARNVYNLAYSAYANAKKELQEAQNQKQQANTVVAAAQNAVNIVNQLNDNAQSALTAAQNVYVAAYSALNNANNVVSRLQESLNDAADQLGVAKFNLQQANNNLFVAQARKEQADKATEIVRAQSSALPAEDSTSTYIFAGCEQQAYPTIVGSAFVNDSNKYGYALSSGHTLVFGSCTKRDQSAKKGDVISFNGYLKNGYVHCTSYQRAL